MNKKFEYHKEYPEVVYKDRVYRWFINNTRNMSDSELQKFVNLCMRGNLTFQCADEIDIDDPDISMIDHLLMDIASEKNDELINTYTDEIDWDNDYIEKYSSRMSRKYYESLSKRIRVLEAMIIEGKRDQEILNNFLGDDYYNKYQAIKNKIRDPEYKDIYKMIKMDPSEVKDYIDNFQSNTDVRRSDKKGAELIYQNDLWKVYRITTYKAAQLYGSGTTWCITGRYGGHEERGEYYFNSYIENNKLDGGYYFYIKNDGKTKYCLLRKENGEIHSIWNAEDSSLNLENILTVEPDFPSVPGIYECSNEDERDLISGDPKKVQHALNSSIVNNKIIKKAFSKYIKDCNVDCVKVIANNKDFMDYYNKYWLCDDLVSPIQKWHYGKGTNADVEIVDTILSNGGDMNNDTVLGRFVNEYGKRVKPSKYTMIKARYVFDDDKDTPMSILLRNYGY